MRKREGLSSPSSPECPGLMERRQRARRAWEGDKEREGEVEGIKLNRDKEAHPQGLLAFLGLLPL